MSKKGSFISLNNNFDIDMQKMLIKKLHNYDLELEEATRNTVLNTIFKTLLKSLNEIVRINFRKGVTKNAFTQLYIDMFFTI